MLNSRTNLRLSRVYVYKFLTKSHADAPINAPRNADAI